MQKTIDNDCPLVLRKTLYVSLFAIFILSLLTAYSYYWNIDHIHKEKLTLALAEAKANWNKDAAFRKWATLHGGMYVAPDERTPPNPALAHLPERDLVTTDGKKLTLMNPAYMMRQMTTEFEKKYGIKGKITGKIQLNPVNKPDEWQLKALNLFESKKVKEIIEQQTIDGQPYLRYMKPMYMTKGCVKCHGILGFKDGDLRGGVSVSIPLEQYFLTASETGRNILITHIIIWIIGFLAIIFMAKIINKMLTLMSHEAMHDCLTHLPNISLFKNRLKQALNKYQRDSNNKFAVCFLDLDRFKNLNDSHGHSVGDKLLITLSQRISKLLRPGDTIARMGGDEFTILLDNIISLKEAITITERILDSFKEPFIIDGDEIYTNTSIGICLSSEEYNDVEEMIRNADIAMYRAKSSGKGQINIFNPEMHEFAIETMKIENDLRSAIKKNQLEVYYQPVIDLEKNRIDGFEALLRWKHPVLGYVSPERFIPIAENTGHIKEIGQWVLERACRQTQDWSFQFCPENEFSIAVNLSGVQLSEHGIHKKIEDVLNQTEMLQTKLHLEVTETALLGHKEEAQAIIKKIRNSGISLSIDDFGKGYCSLTYLQEFDFDILKIDKDFIQDMGPDGKGLQLARTLMLLANDLDMKVVAEGVETEEQLNLLKEMKCPYIQGYYYSRPLPASRIKVLLQAGCHDDSDLLLDQ
ncbi:MAG: EAL domain-containing protein [Gammaproteobacteria bacterium]|nr:EAL domain-containing protein [Gammaproteobacteria bacterium]